MRCRRLKRTNDGQLIVVWFGSYGKWGIKDEGHELGTAKFFNEDDKHDNFAIENEAVADSLTQRLNVIRGEIWYDLQHGLPLIENPANKTIIDSSVVDIVMAHPDVIGIKNFVSSKFNRAYTASLNVMTIYGEIELSI